MSTSELPKVRIGVIGGSGLYQFNGLTDIEETRLDTPYGPPSDAIMIGKLGQISVAFLPRHGRKHSILPSELNHKANIHAMKQLGVRWLISMSAVGSLTESIQPGQFVFTHQFFDRTKRPASDHTFFGDGMVAHVPFGRPICQKLSTILYQSANTVGIRSHWGGTYVNMEGPAFSTRSQSEFYRRLNHEVIGMTNLGEAKLAREAEISYATVAMVTDYDCWHESEAEVNVTEVVRVLQENAEKARKLLAHAIPQVPLDFKTECHTSLATSLLTPREHWPEERIEELGPILAPYL